MVKERARRLREKGEAALRRHLDGEVGARRRVLTERGGIGRTEQFTPVRLRGAGRARASSSMSRSPATTGDNCWRRDRIGGERRRIMATQRQQHTISTMAELEALFPDEVYPPAKVKETDRITKAYRDADRGLAVLRDGDQRARTGSTARRAAIPRASCACVDDKTVIVPDRRGNNRIDSLRNLVSDPRIALLFLIPGVSETLRVMGRATISTDPELCASFTMQGKAPRCVLVIAVEQVFFQCAKAIVRSKLWDPAIQVERVDACRPPARSSPRSAAARSAATSTTASRRSA